MGVKRKSLKEWLRDLTVHLVLAEDKIDALEDKVSNLENYSTSETVIGTWVDGKPLYRKVYVFNGNWAANATGSFSVADLNIDTCVNLRGFMTSSTYGHIGFDFYNSSYNYMYLSGLNTIFWKIGWASTRNTVIIEYTKQTTS